MSYVYDSIERQPRRPELSLLLTRRFWSGDPIDQRSTIQVFFGADLDIPLALNG
jgi:hypothetical protein